MDLVMWTLESDETIGSNSKLWPEARMSDGRDAIGAIQGDLLRRIAEDPNLLLGSFWTRYDPGRTIVVANPDSGVAAVSSLRGGA